MNLYELNDYKEVLRVVTNSRREQFGLRFTFEKMALACGIQKTYLSKVLNGSGHLNADQLFSAAEFLKIKDDQIDFVLLLRDAQLAQNSKRQKILQKKIEAIRSQQLKTAAHISTVPLKINPEALWEYYTNFDLQLVHVFLTIPQFAANPTTIGLKIGLEKEQVLNLILKLENWGLIENKNGSIKMSELNTHLPEDSPIVHSYRLLSRLRAIEFLNKHSASKTLSDDYSMSALFSAGQGFQKKLRLQLIKLIKEAHSNVSDANPEDVFLLNIDFLRWNK